MTGQDTDLTTRVGIEAADGVEAGITAKWDCASEIEWKWDCASEIEWGPEPDQIGPYALLTASWLVEQNDTGPQAPPPISWLEGLVAIPYAGVDFVDDVDNGNFSNLQPNWIFGTNDQASDDTHVGIYYKF
jgi:hypothetical protein